MELRDCLGPGHHRHRTDMIEIFKTLYLKKNCLQIRNFWSF